MFSLHFCARCITAIISLSRRQLFTVRGITLSWEKAAPSTMTQISQPAAAAAYGADTIRQENVIKDQTFNCSRSHNKCHFH
jgi:hypothetical protein